MEVVIGNKNMKDFDSIEESQKIKSSNEPDNEEEGKDSKDNINIRKLAILIGGIVLLVIMIFFIFNYFRTEYNSYNPPYDQRRINNQPFQPFQQNQQNQQYQQNQQNLLINQKNETNQQPIPPIENNQIPPLEQNNTLQQIPLQQNLSLPQNLASQQNEIHQVYEIKNQLNLNISNYLSIFPKLNLKKKWDVKLFNLDKIFNSKILYLNDANITYDYIHFIRQKDKDEDKYKKKTFENLYFDPNIALPREGQIPLKDFYKICQQKKIDFVNKNIASKEPNISIVIPIFNKTSDIVKTIRSIQNQTYKSLEIIIVDDIISNYKESYKNFFKNEPRLRVFSQLKRMSIWRKRLDGFLYSRGKYILHIFPGDILADNYVLEDLYNLVTKYDLDTVRFSFSKTKYNEAFNDNPIFGNMMIYPQKYIRIEYGRPDYNVHIFGYGTIYNRLVRANMFTKGLELVDENILNANKDLWEDMWWNDLIDRVSFSNLVVNRLGYIFLYNRNTSVEPTIKNIYLKDKTIREFIYFWYFDYILLPKSDNKKAIIKTISDYNRLDNTFCRLPMHVDFLLSKFDIYERLLILLIEDPFVLNEDKQIIKEIYKKYQIRKEIFKKKEEEEAMQTDIKSNELKNITKIKGKEDLKKKISIINKTDVINLKNETNTTQKEKITNLKNKTNLTPKEKGKEKEKETVIEKVTNLKNKTNLTPKEKVANLKNKTHLTTKEKITDLKNKTHLTPKEKITDSKNKSNVTQNETNIKLKNQTNTTDSGKITDLKNQTNATDSGKITDLKNQANTTDSGKIADLKNKTNKTVGEKTTDLKNQTNTADSGKITDLKNQTNTTDSGKITDLKNQTNTTVTKKDTDLKNNTNATITNLNNITVTNATNETKIDKDKQNKDIKNEDKDKKENKNKKENKDKKENKGKKGKKDKKKNKKEEKKKKKK